MGNGMDEELVQELFDAVDTNHDGKITFTEFVDAVQVASKTRLHPDQPSLKRHDSDDRLFLGGDDN